MNGRNISVQSGRVLGGGSSVNFMMYSRPAASDIDDWNTPGWSFNEMEPLFKKAPCLPPVVADVSLKRTKSPEAKMIMDISDQFMFLTVEPRVVFPATFLKLRKPIMRLILLLIYKTSTVLIERRNTRNGLISLQERGAMPLMRLFIPYLILRTT